MSKALPKARATMPRHLPRGDPEAEAGEITLKINGEMRQQGDVNQMIWKVAEVISRLSELFPLAPGDLIFTGTPAGVGPVRRGDYLHAHVEGVGDLRLRVT